MPAYRSILTALQALVAALFGLAVTSREEFQSLIPEHGNLAYLGALFGLFFLFRMTEPIANFIIEKIPGFSPALRRLMAGNSCIEGDWPLVVLGGDIAGGRPEVRYVGYMTITYTNGQLKVRGTDWFEDGRHAVDFESQKSQLDGNLLQYWYHQGELGSQRGYTEIYFFPADGPKMRLAGEFLDKEHNSARFYARRFKAERGQRRPKTEKERLEAARAFWAGIKAGCATIAARPLSADWE